jgi:glycosyltransferase involved in cell wall biosynthesis
VNRICLNAIVKNEAARIERMLASVEPHIGCWVICDTGSTDGTQAKIRDFFGEHCVPGLLYETTFENFSQARNEALNIARTSPLVPDFDYVLLCDADMELVAPDGIGDLIAPAYLLEQRSGDLRYWNTRLVRRDAPAEYKGVTHEYLSVEGAENLHHAWFIDHADGANRPGKFDRDIALLEEALMRDPDDARSVFYLAQSYKDRGDFAKAAELYERRAEMGGFDEEVFCSWLAASRCMRALG